MGNGRRAGLAIVRVELEEIDAGRVLILVKTVDDVIEAGEPQQRAFSSASQAVEHLAEWLAGWTAKR